MLTNTINTLRYSFFRHHLRYCSQVSCPNEENVIIEKLGEITIIGLNRPSKRNCLNYATAKSLTDALQRFEEDNSSRTAVIHGNGGNFCAGMDLTEITSLDTKKLNENKIKPLELPHRLIKKPLVAALSGYAVAEGFELALMCDLRVMEENAVMGMYNRRFGISSANGGIVRLSAILGLSRALDVVLTGRTVTAQEAFNWGLVNRIVACGTALGQAIQVAGSLVKFPQKCLLQDRKTLYESAFRQSFQELLDYERNNSIFDEESIEGAKKFVESGIGKHGKTYDLKERVISDWEKE
ncbi:2,3-dehydroadipyl-CoA hydratase-like [Harmonia axyridis]|uniref:2,3-dehydroadipyl-CoA hydratase-like n=1 Tax=Harmonia axyridis TaxID=115357 RepID=UPI001E27935A|nr:2,3-dehydroadipyl-CoA hydratase-like [Harmonia axyridis]